MPWTTPSSQARAREAVQPPPARRADAPARVVRQPEDDQAPPGDDAHRRPDARVGGDQRQRDVGHARAHVAVAEQREGVDQQRHDRGERQRLVRHPEVGAAALQQPPAHQQAERHGGGGCEQRRDPRRPARDPEEVLAHGGGQRGHDCEVVTGAASEELESSVVESSVVALSVVEVAAAVELWVEAVRRGLRGRAHRAVEGDHAPRESERGERAGDDPPAEVGDAARPRGEAFTARRGAIRGRWS